MSDTRVAGDNDAERANTSSDDKTSKDILQLPTTTIIMAGYDGPIQVEFVSVLHVIN